MVILTTVELLQWSVLVALTIILSDFKCVLKMLTFLYMTLQGLLVTELLILNYVVTYET